MLLLEVEAPRTEEEGRLGLQPSFFLGAWVRSGMTTALVATEQLRSAVGFEQEQDTTEKPFHNDVDA